MDDSQSRRVGQLDSCQHSDPRPSCDLNLPTKVCRVVQIAQRCNRRKCVARGGHFEVVRRSESRDSNRSIVVMYVSSRSRCIHPYRRTATCTPYTLDLVHSQASHSSAAQQYRYRKHSMSPCSLARTAARGVRLARPQVSAPSLLTSSSSSTTSRPGDACFPPLMQGDCTADTTCSRLPPLT